MPGTLYVSDLDGTLLLPDATLGPYTRTVLGDFVAGGGMFTYATARSFHSAGRAVRGVDLRLPVITYGGAITVDPVSGTAEEAATMSPAAVDVALRLLSRHGVPPLVFAIHDGRDRVCWIELTHAGGTKARAVRAVAAGAGADRIVCFGDNLNDLSMFAVADQSYAVSNAVREVHAAATAVIGSNADEAVARWLAAAMSTAMSAAASSRSGRS